MSKTVIAICGVYASGKKLSQEDPSVISDGDYQLLSAMKKVKLVEQAKKEAKASKKSTKEGKKDV